MKQARAGYVFILPFLLIFFGVLVLPLGYAAYLSLYKEQLVGGVTFVGLDNYVEALSDPKLHAGVLRVAQFFLLQVPLMLVMSLFFALALDSGRLRMPKVFRLGIFVPYAVPSVIAALMWGYFYGRDFGPIGQAFSRLGATAPDLLGGDLILGSLANIVTWEFTGYNMIILFAALRAIPAELYEAAAVDGAGAWRIAWSIKIPAIRSAILLCVIFSVIGSFQLFNEPNLVQRLAPSSIDNAFTPNLYAYSLAFIGQELNYAAAVSFLLGVVIVAVSYLVLALTNRKPSS
ncbi:MAG TPA: sugar ABC transporter permease [Actinoplanes sp.]|nr:sugar ABC transporter permease [Actinoplanes sp.]